MMQGAIEEARSNGVEQLELFVDTENHRAIAFYGRQGFERVATHPDVTRIAGKRRND
ncbi:MAG: GNAT family N-acetyltransferase [Pseudomonadota bacterium]